MPLQLAAFFFPACSGHTVPKKRIPRGNLTDSPCCEADVQVTLPPDAQGLTDNKMITRRTGELLAELARVTPQESSPNGRAAKKSPPATGSDSPYAEALANNTPTPRSDNLECWCRPWEFDRECRGLTDLAPSSGSPRLAFIFPRVDLDNDASAFLVKRASC